MKNKIYLHIGLGKTGTSSLQSYLSYNPCFHSNSRNENIVYCAIDNNFELISSDGVTRHAKRTLLNYQNSWSELPSATDKEILKIEKEIKLLHKKGLTPLFSQEDWARRSQEFIKSEIFRKLGYEIELIVYVRPQVEFFNSGWWQWWAWDEQFTNPDDVLNKWGINFVLWGSMLEKWQSIPQVKKINVRLHSRNIISDFFSLFDSTYDASKIHKENISANLNIIKVYKQFKEINKKVQTTLMNSVLSQTIKGASPPWALSEELVNKIIDLTKEDNVKLKNMLDGDLQSKMALDPSWWDCSYYADKKLLPEEDFQISAKEYSETIYLLVKDLIEVKTKCLHMSHLLNDGRD